MKIRLVRRYARALFRLALRWQVLREVEEELTVVEQVFAEEEVGAFFDNPTVAATAKKATIQRLFGNVSGLVQNFLCFMADKRRLGLVPEVIKAYRELVKRENNILEVRVVTAAPLNEEDQRQLVGKLAEITGKTIELHSQVDQRTLGGLIIQIGDKLIDNSVTTKLAMLKTYMLSKSM